MKDMTIDNLTYSGLSSSNQTFLRARLKFVSDFLMNPKLYISWSFSATTRKEPDWTKYGVIFLMTYITALHICICIHKRFNNIGCMTIQNVYVLFQNILIVITTISFIVSTNDTRIYLNKILIAQPCNTGLAKYYMSCFIAS